LPFANLAWSQVTINGPETAQAEVASC